MSRLFTKDIKLPDRERFIKTYGKEPTSNELAQFKRYKHKVVYWGFNSDNVSNPKYKGARLGIKRNKNK